MLYSFMLSDAFPRFEVPITHAIYTEFIATFFITESIYTTFGCGYTVNT